MNVHDSANAAMSTPLPSGRGAGGEASTAPRQ